MTESIFVVRRGWPAPSLPWDSARSPRPETANPAAILLYHWAKSLVEATLFSGANAIVPDRHRHDRVREHRHRSERNPQRDDLCRDPGNERMPDKTVWSRHDQRARGIERQRGPHAGNRQRQCRPDHQQRRQRQQRDSEHRLRRETLNADLDLNDRDAHRDREQEQAPDHEQDDGRLRDVPDGARALGSAGARHTAARLLR